MSDIQTNLTPEQIQAQEDTYKAERAAIDAMNKALPLIEQVAQNPAVIENVTDITQVIGSIAEAAKLAAESQRLTETLKSPATMINQAMGEVVNAAVETAFKELTPVPSFTTGPVIPGGKVDVIVHGSVIKNPA